MAARNVGFVVLLFTLILSGCQTLSKEECVAADWRVIWTYPDLVERLSLYDCHFRFECDGRFVAQ